MATGPEANNRGEHMKCEECGGWMIPLNDQLEWWVCIQCGVEKKVYT
jgi:hypothetical protein